MLLLLAAIIQDTMQILIISLPPGEQAASLTHTVDANEVVIGRGSDCQIQLPDRQQKELEGRHVRLFLEDTKWYLENISSKLVQVNYQDIIAKESHQILLNDGDIITCGGYRLMFSYLPPKGTSEQYARMPAPGDEDSLTGKSSVYPSVIPEVMDLYDPFDHAILQGSEKTEVDNTDLPALFSEERELSDKGLLLQNNNAFSLIDVLANDPDKDDEWVINRHLWGQDNNDNKVSVQDYSRPLPELSDLQTSNESKDRATLIQGKQQESRIHQAMLYALKSVLETLSPDTMKKALQQRPGSLTGRPFFSFGSDTSQRQQSRYWRYYQVVYRDLMHEQKYRLLFIEYFQQALSAKEKSHEE